jgi:hypothetical protein
MLSCAAESGGAAGEILEAPPQSASPQSDYILYLHGRIIETEGIRPTHPRFGIYEYEAVLRALAANGASVISEVRPEDTEAGAYAHRLVSQIESLIAAGASAERITVVGFSKGGAIAAIAASRVEIEGLRFVFQGTCGPWMKGHRGIDLRGEALSIFEASDEVAGSCREIFMQSPRLREWKEVRINIGGGHGAFYRPDPAWVEPVLAWSERAIAGDGG